MTWTIIFGTLGALSVILNGVLIWYTSKILSKLLYTADNLGDLYVVFASFKTFVSSLYQMDMFHVDIFANLPGKCIALYRPVGKYLY